MSLLLDEEVLILTKSEVKDTEKTNACKECMGRKKSKSGSRPIITLKLQAFLPVEIWSTEENQPRFSPIKMSRYHFQIPIMVDFKITRKLKE